VKLWLAMCQKESAYVCQKESSYVRKGISHVIVLKRIFVCA